MNEEIIYSPTNKQAITSLILGILTILTFCISWIPFPFTGFICFPLSALLGFLSLLFGIVALNQIRKRNESGRPMAWTGIIIGGFVFVCMLCMLIAVISLFIIAPESFPAPEFFDNYQI
ncbi:MAG: DUF4190 domain-containing protein [Anaerolineales bacterium]|nr:DUF4190 domain-containing protein [Anaerolineales bacterium]